MKKIHLALLSVVIFILCFLLISPAARAVFDAFEVSWWTADSGGEQTASGAYNLQGVAGQPDAGFLQGGNYSLAGGFLGGGFTSPPFQKYLYLPFVTR
jgi:hypothetical protein